MTITNIETNILTNVALEYHSAKTLETVNKIYRQSRNWARYHCYFANACTPERCTELNHTFKLMREEAIKRLVISNEEA